MRADVPLVLAAYKDNQRCTRLEQLSGRVIPLPAGNVAEGAVELANQRPAQRRMAPIQIEKLDTSLAAEDVMETVQTGTFGFTVVEQPIAEY